MSSSNKRFNPNQRFNGSFIPEELSKFPDVSPGAKLVWGRFYRYAGNTGGIFPSMETLASEIGLGVKQTRVYVHELISSGLIEFEQKPGKIRNYYFTEGAVFGPKPEKKAEPVVVSDDDLGTPPVCETPPVSETPTPPVSERGPLPYPRAEESHLRESYEESHKKPSIVSLNPTSTEEQTPEPAEYIATLLDEDLELTVDNISEWVQDLFHDKTGRKYSTIMGKDRGRFVAMAESMGTAGLRRKIEEFIDSGGKTPADFLRKMPSAAKNLSMRRETYPGSVVREKRSVDSDYLPKRPTQPSAFVSEKHTDGSAALVERWNQLVPAKPASFEGARGYSVAMLDQMRLDQEFMAGFDTICKKAQAILENKPVEASWLSFGWLFRIAKDNSGPNWGKLLRGELDMMAVKPKAAAGPNAEAMSNLEKTKALLKKGKKE